VPPAQWLIIRDVEVERWRRGGVPPPRASRSPGSLPAPVHAGEDDSASRSERKLLSHEDGQEARGSRAPPVLLVVAPAVETQIRGHPKRKANPYPATITLFQHIHCGDNPFLHARLVSDLGRSAAAHPHSRGQSATIHSGVEGGTARLPQPVSARLQRIARRRDRPARVRWPTLQSLPHDRRVTPIGHHESLPYAALDPAASADVGFLRRARTKNGASSCCMIVLGTGMPATPSFAGRESRMAVPNRKSQTLSIFE
jgi:hypothetical protein